MGLFGNKKQSVINQQAMHAKRVLLVQDDEALAAKYIPALNSNGYDVNHLHVADDILASVLNYEPSVVVFDSTMEGLNILDVVDIVQNTQQSSEVKIMILSGLSDETERQHLIELGADAYLAKSQASPEVLISQINQLFAPKQ